MDDLKLVVCGRPNEGKAKDSLDQIATSLDSFGSRAIALLTSSQTDPNFIFAPLCGRVVLENSCAAIVGRIDAFRLIYISEFQSKAEYEVGKRAKSSFSWTGDVFPSGGNIRLWDIDNDVPKIGRALFSQHYEELYWKPAVADAIDFINDNTAVTAPPELSQLDPENFVSLIKGRSNQAYSGLSKGVHWEFFNQASVLDETTTKGLLKEACTIAAMLGFVSHFIPTAHSSIDPAEALEHFGTFIGRLP